MLHFIHIPLYFSMSLVVSLLASLFQLSSTVSIIGVMFDEVAVMMVYLTCLVMFISFMVGLMFLSTSMVVSMFFMFIICLFVFTTNNMFIFYLFYEASLVPILYIIMKWGSYPDRSVSSIMLLLYTSIFTFPLLYVILWFYSIHSTFIFAIMTPPFLSSSLFSLLVFLSFCVKLPIYGLHFWLPMAHVEAPTFGSMILAGVLLKLGGVGLFRFSSIFNFHELKLFIIGYFLFFLIYSTMLCCFQSDFKRLVAYSSVSHMMCIPIMIVSSSLIGSKGVISLMFLHGVSSPLLFMLVGLMYSLFSTRQHILMRGLIMMSPVVSFIMIMTFLFAISAPPFPSFVSEVMFVLSGMYLWVLSAISLGVFLFLSMVYNLMWLTSINFLTQELVLNYSSTFNFSVFLPSMVLVGFSPLVFMVLFFFVL